MIPLRGEMGIIPIVHCLVGVVAARHPTERGEALIVNRAKGAREEGSEVERRCIIELILHSDTVDV
ncbi:MAG: hypothetical protein KF716_07830 [Anaerolineae bacterium]|nr:hypothetical protein [Anaerolineae bacterium]